MTHSQDHPAYQLFSGEGKAVKYSKLVRQATGADIVLFGEAHDNPISHWLQLELTRMIHEEKAGDLVLGAEMFESDNQLLIDEYFSGLISTANFEKEARLWNNYPTDYKPLLEFARENGLAFVATNIPRRYANLVYRQGIEALDSLTETAKAFIAPLPITIDLALPGYQQMMKMMEGHGGEQNEKFPQSQAVKDATMAYFILQNHQTGQLFLHFNGSYHSNNYEGIGWYLKKERPALNILTITTVEQENIDKLEEENEGLADFIICVPANMTKTY